MPIIAAVVFNHPLNTNHLTVISHQDIIELLKQFDSLGLM